MKNIQQLICLVVMCMIIHKAHAQVPVREEPHHKPVLENDYIRLLDIHINAGDTTFYHVHATPSVIVFISKSTIGSQKLGEAPSAANEVEPAQTSFVDYGTNPITHRVFNAGKNVFHVMDIELVNKEPTTDSCDTLKNVTTTTNEKLVRVDKLELNDQQPFIINKCSYAHLLVCIAGGISALAKSLKEGDFIFFNPNTSISFSNNQHEKSTCILLELK